MSNRAKKQLILHIPYVIIREDTESDDNDSDSICESAAKLPSVRSSDWCRMCSDLPPRCLYERQECKEIPA